MSRAALNLMDNAAKWSPPGGQVGVRLRQLDASHAELAVWDHGPGIPSQERRLVFERFYRSTTARAMPGSGLGLAIVKQVVLKHGGMLRVEDTVPGGQPPGTAIYVALPGRPMPVGPSAPPVAGSGADDPDTHAGPGASAPENTANFGESANVISVDSQSARAR